jgi:hypothetical protein
VTLAPAVTSDQFRLDFQEFADESIFSDSLCTQWLNLATHFVNANRWKAMSNFGMELWAAHYITLSARAQQVIAAGGLPGEVNGAVTAKSIDKVSISFDSSAVYTNAGDLNLTLYGINYSRLSKLFGTGPMQFA